MNDSLLLIIVLLVGGIVLLTVLSARGATYEIESAISNDYAVGESLRVVGTKRNWTTLSHTRDGASFAYKTNASCLTAFVLLLFFLIPGILYLALGGDNASLSVQVRDLGPRRAVRIVASGSEGRSMARRLRRRLLSPGVIQQANLAASAELAFQADQLRDSKTCPQCAESVKAAATVCRYCAYRFAPEGAWFDDPVGRHELRWWDGQQWTDLVSNAGVESHEPQA